MIAGPSPYRDHGELERALRASGADAAWVGWGFVAEDPAFAELCARNGIAFIGPPPDVIRRLGDEAGVKRLAEQAGLRVDARDGDGGRRRSGRASRRRAGLRRRARRRLGRRCSGVLDPARQPEADRGVELAGARRRAGRRAAGGGRRPGPVGRLPRRRDRRVPLSPRRAGLRVHRVHRVPAGRARRHRDDDGARPREAADPRRRGRAPGGRAADPVRPRDRGPAQRRGPRAWLRPRVRERSSCSRCPRGRGCASRRVLPWATSSRRTTTQPWPRSSAGAGIAPRRARGCAGRWRRRPWWCARGRRTSRFLLDLLDRPEMVAGTAGAGWLDRVVAAGGHVPTRHAGVALLAAAIDVYDSEQERRARRVLCGGHAGPAPGEPRDRPDGRSQPPRPELSARRRADGSAPLPDRGRWRDRRRAGRAPPPLRAPAGDRR